MAATWVVVLGIEFNSSARGMGRKSARGRAGILAMALPRRESKNERKVQETFTMWCLTLSGYIDLSLVTAGRHAQSRLCEVTNQKECSACHPPPTHLLHRYICAREPVWTYRDGYLVRPVDADVGIDDR